MNPKMPPRLFFLFLILAFEGAAAADWGYKGPNGDLEK